jgi:hypothetical protein
LLVAAFVLLAYSLKADTQEPPELASPFLPIEPVVSETQPSGELQWNLALSQSYRYLVVEHAFRMAFQAKTRRELGGPFLQDYAASLGGLRGWGDGDSWLTNYVGHPLHGAVAGYLYLQNHRVGRLQEFDFSSLYWNSRLKAMLWSAAYSTAFEVGPLSEATLGNVGKNPNTSGYVDHVMTPSGAFGVIVGEEALDRYFIRKWEDRTSSENWRRFLRVAFNPSRSFANILRGKVPWHRDTRPLRNTETP